MLHRLKNYTALYFSLELLFYAVALTIFDATTVTFAVLLEIALLGLTSALLRVILIPCVKLPPTWEVYAFVALADAIAIVFAVVFGWFAALPVGVYVVFGVYNALVYGMELLIKEQPF